MGTFSDGRFHCIYLLILMGMSLVFTTDTHAVSENLNTGRYGGEYRVPLESEPSSLDPAIFTDIYAMNVANNIFDGLVEFDENLSIVPAIAKVWKISRDHRTYTFHLRKGVRFHNGREVTADDFIFSFSRILNPQTHSPAAALFLNIRGARNFNAGRSQKVSGLYAEDRHTLIIELEKPFAPFLSILAMANAKVVPKEAVRSNFGQHPVGTGPFCFQTWQPGNEIILAANRNYFAGRPYLDRLRFRIYQNIEWEKVFADYNAGHLDQALIPSNQYELHASTADFNRKHTVISMPVLNIVYVGMNLSVPIFKDRRVRQAVCHAVDSESITRTITRRASKPAQGILPPGIPGFNPDFEGYAYNTQKARELLAEAGYPDGKGIEPIEIWTVSKSDTVKQELQAYRRYFADIGIELVPRVADSWKAFIQRIKEKKAPMFYAAWYADFPDPDNFLYTLFHSESRTNRMGYHNPAVDRLLEEARSELDYMNRVTQYHEIEEIIMQDAPVIPQHHNSFNYIFQSWVRNVEMSHLGAIYLPFRKIWTESQQDCD